MSVSLDESFDNYLNEAALAQTYKPIEEDSIIPKIFAAIPFFGFVGFIARDNLRLAIALEKSPARLIELIRVKNDYHVAGLVHDLIGTALAIVGLVAGILFPPLGGFCTAILLFAAAIEVQTIERNNKAMERLKNGRSLLRASGS
jgi:hypothetical protein